MHILVVPNTQKAQRFLRDYGNSNEASMRSIPGIGQRTEAKLQAEGYYSVSLVTVIHASSFTVMYETSFIALFSSILILCVVPC